MKGHEAVRKFQYLTTSWNIDLSRKDDLDREDSFGEWLDAFVIFCEKNCDRSEKEMHNELVDAMIRESGNEKD